MPVRTKAAELAVGELSEAEEKKRKGHAPYLDDTENDGKSSVIHPCSLRCFLSSYYMPVLGGNASELCLLGAPIPQRVKDQEVGQGWKMLS